MYIFLCEQCLGIVYFEISIVVPPSWNTIPTDVDALSEDSVILNCKASGRPTPSVAWFRTFGKFFTLTNNF